VPPKTAVEPLAVSFLNSFFWYEFDIFSINFTPSLHSAAQISGSTCSTSTCHSMLSIHAAVLAFMLSPPATVVVRTIMRPQVSLGLIDWMLDTPFLPPGDQLCRSEGWDCTATFSTSLVNQVTGPKSYSTSLDFGLRFKKDGSFALVSPSALISSKEGRWSTVEEEAGGEPEVQWQLTVCDSGIRGGPAGSGAMIVGPLAKLYFTMRLDSDSDALRLSQGKVWVKEGDRMQPVGTCHASPLPLMGNN